MVFQVMAGSPNILSYSAQPGRGLTGGKPMRIDDAFSVDRPIEDVFSFVVDQRNRASWVKSVRSCELETAEPVSSGSEFSLRVRIHGLPVRFTSEITAIDAPHSFSCRSNGAMAVEETWRFERSGSATAVRVTFDLRPRGPLRIVHPLMRLGGPRAALRADHRHLKEVLESHRALSVGRRAR
jgi:uncharacterized membrane protein